MNNVIDELGLVQAQIAELREQEKALKAQVQGLLFSTGEKSLEGDLFRATFSTAERKTVDWKSVAAKFKPSRQLVTANTKVSTVNSLRLFARSTAKKAA